MVGGGGERGEGEATVDSLQEETSCETIGCEKLDPHLETRVRARASVSRFGSDIV